MRATDSAGNTDASPAQFTWTVDTVDPSAVFTFPSASGNYDLTSWNAGCATAGFCGTYSDATSGVQAVEISIRQGTGNYWNGTSFGSASEAFQSATIGGGNWSYAFPASSFPAGGNYTVHVRATDNATNTETGPSRTFTYDTTPPETTIDSNPSDPSTSSGATFTFSADEGGSTFECELDGAGFSSCSSPKSYSSLSDGSHTFKVKATDACRKHRSDPRPVHVDGRHDVSVLGDDLPRFGRGVQRPRLERGLRHRRLLRHLFGCDNGRPEGRDLDQARRGQLLERLRLLGSASEVWNIDLPLGRQLVVRVRHNRFPR